MSPVHPNPAIGTDPFGAHFDSRMIVGNCHGDIIWVFERDPIFRTGVPNRIVRWELTCAFDFQRSPAAVAIHSPMGDIAMVADPIEQLATADIVIPTPVLVDPGLDVRLHL